MKLLLLCAFIGASVAAPVTEDQIVVAVPRLKARHEALNSHPQEWIEGPDTNLYQFHFGEQNWLTAREYCLARNSDLVIIKDSKQLGWLLSHYHPILKGVERILQVGVLKSEDAWKWVDGSELSSGIMDWAAAPEADAACTVLQLNDTRLISSACDKSHVARFICQRNNQIHEKQQRSENFFWGRLDSLLNYFGIGKGNKTLTARPEVEDYDELHLNENITSAEKHELANIAVNTTILSSSEEQDQVEGVLNELSKVPSVLHEKPIPLRSSEEDDHTHDVQDLKAHAPAKPLKEIDEEEGSGHEVEKSDIATEDLEDPEKLQSIIENMEKMIQKLEKLKVSVEETANEISAINPEDFLSSEKTKKKSEGNTEKDVKSVKPKVAGVKNNAVSDDLEKDFDDEDEKKMPVADITPPEEKDEDCDELEDDSDDKTEVEGSGDDDDKLQKPTISKEREEHIRKFLKTLRVFLSRASHDDLRNVLDKKNGKSLLDRMETAIKEANAREFARLEEAQTEGKSSVVQDAVMMNESEQEDLFKRISKVVLHQAEKEGILMTATEASVRTTTEEVELEAPVAADKPAVVGEEESEVNGSGEDNTKEEDSTKVEEKKIEEVEKKDDVKEEKKEEVKEEKKEEKKDEDKKEEVKEDKKDDVKEEEVKEEKKEEVKEKDEVKEEKKEEVVEKKEKKVEKKEEDDSEVEEKQSETKKKHRKQPAKKESEEEEKEEAKEVKKEEEKKKEEAKTTEVEKKSEEKPLKKKEEEKKKNSEDKKAAKEVEKTEKADKLKKGKTQNLKKEEQEKKQKKKEEVVEESEEEETSEEVTAASAVSTSELPKKDERNPLGLPELSTLGPLPTLPPLPSLKEVFAKIDKSFKDLFKPLPTLPPLPTPKPLN